MSKSVSSLSEALPVFGSVLWDFDGVLGDTEKLALQALTSLLNRRLADWGTEIRYDVADVVRSFPGMTVRKILEIVAEKHNLPLCSEVVETFVKEELAGAREILRERMEVTKGLPALLSRLAVEAPAIPHRIVSSSALSRLQDCMEKGQIGWFFPEGTIFSVQELGLPSKPAPDGYLFALCQLGLMFGLVIEDSPSGTRSGKAAGCVVLGYTGAYAPGERPALRERLLSAGADYVIDDWSEFEAAVIELANRLLAAAA